MPNLSKTLDYALAKNELKLYPEGSYIVTNEGKEQAFFTEITVYIATPDGRKSVDISTLAQIYNEYTTLVQQQSLKEITGQEPA